MPSPRETLIFDNWSRGWSRYNFPDDVLLPRMVEDGQITEAEGLEVRPDGSLYWRRDQFIIPINGDLATAITGGATILTITEFTGGAYNQLLCITDAGKFYKLTTDWTNSAVAQVADGYQLSFGAETWSEEETGLDTDTGYATAVTREIMMLCHPDEATMRWDGTSLDDVGITAPVAAPTGPVSQAAETYDLTDSDWNEYDLNSHITVAATSATFASMTNAEYASLHTDLGAAGVEDYKFRFNFTITGGDTSPTYKGAYVWGLTTTPGAAIQSNFEGEWLAVNKDGANTINVELWSQLSDVHGYSTTWAGATATTYYVEVQRIDHSLTVRFYSDVTYTTLVWTDAVNSVAGWGAQGHLRFYYALSSSVNPSGFSISGHVDNPVYYPTALPEGVLSAGTYSYFYTYYDGEFESMPSPVVDVHVESQDDFSIPLVDFPDRTAQNQTKELYRAFTSDTDADARGGDFHWVTSIAKATTTYTDNTLPADLGETLAFDHALPPRGKAMTWHQDRLYMSVLSCTSRSYTDYESSGIGNVLAYSELDEPYYWPGDNIIRIGDSADIVALHSWRHWLLIMKQNSMWTLTGYDPDSDFTLTQIDPDIGIANQYAIASGPQGVVWKSSQGIMFWNGSSIRMIYDYRHLPITPPMTEAYPTICYHRSRFYILEGTRLLTWDPLTDVWGSQFANIPYLGIQNFDFSRKQSHILTAMYWDSANGATPPWNITVLHTNRAFTNYDDAGSVYCDYYAPVKITLPPIIAPPGNIIQPLEVWIDGSWTDTAEEGVDPIQLYVNTSGNYTTYPWAASQDAPQGGNMIGIPGGTAGKVIYIQLEGEYAKDFELNAVGVTVAVRQAKGG